MNLTRFTVFYFLYSFILAGLYSGLLFLFPLMILPGGKFWVLFIFLSGLTYIAYILTDLGLKKNPETGTMAIMGSIALKMFFSIAFILTYSLKGYEMGLGFLLDYFSLYFLFSFFEIYALLRNLRSQNK